MGVSAVPSVVSVGSTVPVVGVVVASVAVVVDCVALGREGRVVDWFVWLLLPLLSMLPQPVIMARVRTRSKAKILIFLIYDYLQSICFMPSISWVIYFHTQVITTNSSMEGDG
jgi:hypothetical protein